MEGKQDGGREGELIPNLGNGEVNKKYRTRGGEVHLDIFIILLDIGFFPSILAEPNKRINNDIFLLKEFPRFFVLKGPSTIFLSLFKEKRES